jgi:hypothetical protein
VTRNSRYCRSTVEELAVDCLDARELYKEGALDGGWFMARALMVVSQDFRLFKAWCEAKEIASLASGQHLKGHLSQSWPIMQNNLSLRLSYEAENALVTKFGQGSCDGFNRQPEVVRDVLAGHRKDH